MTELRQRQPREECPAFLAFVRTHPCCVCGTPAPSQAAHIRLSDAARGVINPGVGAKPHDRLAVPLCAGCHLDDAGAQHRVGERAFWDRVSIDPFPIADALWSEFNSKFDVKITIKRKPRSRAWDQPARNVIAACNELIRASKIPARKNAWPPRGSRSFNRRKTCQPSTK